MAKRSFLLSVAGIGVAVAALCFLLHNPVVSNQEDKRALWYGLGEYARQMIKEDAPGVVRSDSGDFIGSYQSFYNYIAKRAPGAVAPPNANNPFPAILPGKSYLRPSGKISAKSQSLISTAVYDLPSGRVAFVLRADGGVDVR